MGRAIIVVIAITFTIDWRPFLGPRPARSARGRSFQTKRAGNHGTLRIAEEENDAPTDTLARLWASI
jgi:hypothetical protein